MDIKQLEHSETHNLDAKKDIIVVSENVRTPENIGMIFRVAESFGVSELYFCGDSPDLNSKKVRKTSRSTENQVKSHFDMGMNEVIVQLQTNGYSLLALELTNKSSDIRNFKINHTDKIAIFVGSERNGISEETLQAMNEAVYIPMKGKNSSINVVNALSVCLYEISNQLENK